jgi:two-component system invasion response regulator UvrY
VVTSAKPEPAIPGAIRLVVIDDHPAIATAIEAAVTVGSGVPEIHLVGRAPTPEAAEVLIRDARPDVVLCDVQLRAATDGLDVIAIARECDSRVIVLTSCDRASFMRAAFERGASGFLHKGAEMEEILEAVRVVAAGGTAFSGATLDAARTAPRLPSDREVAVLVEVNKGATSEEIGAHLGISARTVESHLRRLFDRYGVVSRTELAVLSVREGWVDPASA